VNETSLRIETGSGTGVSAVLTPGATASDWLFAYAPGAGANIDDSFAVFAASILPAAGVGVLRFQFPYQEAKKSVPDSNTILEATWHAVIERARALAEGQRLVIGGRSMGGRIASQVVASGAAAEALALFAYPLHPTGRPQQRRDAHLPAITVRTLFCSGNRDAFASPEEIAGAAAMVDRGRLHLLDGADHGFAVLKSSGRARADVWQEACEALIGFLREDIS
jgi:predicted alpha/beta-hydrolase family hydrolase